MSRTRGAPFTRLSLIVSLFCSVSAFAIEPSGDLKLFHLMSGAPRGAEDMGGQSSGALTARLKLKERWGAWEGEGHVAMNALGGGAQGSLLSLSPNLNSAEEPLPLRWQVIDEGGASALVRVDRLTLSYELGSVRLKLGRQALSFGQGRAFTPLDRVSPFSPASVDREYKPGVDAVRVDGYWGVAGEWTMVAAVRTGWGLYDTVLGARAQDSFGGWDIGLVGLWVGGDLVAGLSLGGALGDLSAFGDLTWTRRARSGPLAEADEARGTQADFLRGSVGVEGSWAVSGGGGLSLELAWLGDGSSEPNELMSARLDPRVMSGERWLLGRAYGALSLNQSLTPLIRATLTVISNLEDRSALLGPGLSWSISDEVSANLGSYFGVGEGLDPQWSPQSELGALRWLTFAMMSAYF